MHLLPVVLIVSTLGTAPIEARYPQAVEVYSCGFEEDTDRNYDGWPEDWTRRRGPGYPHYVPISIAQENSPAGKQCLRMKLDGGAALVQSPPIPIESAATYVLEVFVRTEALMGDEAYAAITFLNHEKRPLNSVRLPGVRDATSWRKLRLGPVGTNHASARYAVIELALGPAVSEDLRGAAWFDDVWFARLPRMSIRTNQPYNLFRPGETIEVACQVSGFDEELGQIVFDLLDVDGQRLAGHEAALRRASVSPSDDRQEPGAARQATIDLSWRPPIVRPGFFRVRVAMRSGPRQILTRELSLAVIEPRTGAAEGEFGWSLSRGAGPMPLAEVAQLVGRVGVSWVKYPLWLSERELANNDDLVHFVERLGARKIEIVGLLSRPPEELQKQFGRKDALTAADVFTAEPDVWYPSLEPVLTQLSMKVRWWQLGDDTDISLIGYPLLPSKMAQIKKHMDRIGQDTRLGFGWNWMEEFPSTGPTPWRFVTMSASPSLTADELANYLDRPRGANVQRWVMIEPLPRDNYDTPTRAADLTHRLLTSKKHGAQRIFATQPFSSSQGLLNDDGTPGELLAPWLTTVGALSGARHVGALPMDGGSPNEIFAGRNGEAVMFVWSQTPRLETLDLGGELKQVDLWGRDVPLADDGPRQRIRVGPTPSLVTGMPETVIRTALSFRFQDERFPSVLGQTHVSRLQFQNCFPRGASGKLKLITPEGWDVEPREFDFKLAAGETFQAPYQLRFPYDANNGVQDVRVAFSVAAERSFQFSIPQQLRIGLGDLSLVATTELADNGELLVHQRLVNHTDDAVSFKCDLYATRRRRQRTQVLELSRGEEVQTYRLPAGRELIGQSLWIRAEEVGGQRVLSHRFTVEE